MSMTDDTLDYLEKQIPELAETAVRQAYWQALASGSHVLEACDGFLVEIAPNGTRKIIKQLTPPTPAIRGQRILIP